ncbi:MAG: SMP-30/gluconolactonase/LRE family protein, partial [Pseudomonadota bacterium]
MTFFEAHDPVFETYVLGNAPVKQIATGFDWVEGPVWFGDANCLLFSDIPNNRIMRWTPELGVSVYRAPSNFANGHTRDLQGRLISCEHGTRRVTRTLHDGTIEVVASHVGGKRLNSPNDVIVASDGAVWFTDPHYGIMTNYEGFAAEQELPCRVYRVDPESGEVVPMIDSMNCPNGLAFSPDESMLYVADTGRMFSDDPQHIRRFRVTSTGLEDEGVFHQIAPGASDGFRLDSDGNIWSSAADGVQCIAPDGRLLG